MSPTGRHFLEHVQFDARGYVACVPSPRMLTRDWRAYVDYAQLLLRMSRPNQKTP